MEKNWESRREQERCKPLRALAVLSVPSYVVSRCTSRPIVLWYWLEMSHENFITEQQDTLHQSYFFCFFSIPNANLLSIFWLELGNVWTTSTAANIGCYEWWLQLSRTLNEATLLSIYTLSHLHTQSVLNRLCSKASVRCVSERFLIVPFSYTQTAC